MSLTRRRFLRFLGLGAVAAPVAVKNAMALAQPSAADMPVLTNHVDLMINGREFEMAAISNIVGIREDFTDFLTIVEPEDSPKLTMYFKRPKDF